MIRFDNLQRPHHIKRIGAEYPIQQLFAKKTGSLLLKNSFGNIFFAIIFQYHFPSVLFSYPFSFVIVSVVQNMLDSLSTTIWNACLKLIV